MSLSRQTLRALSSARKRPEICYLGKLKPNKVRALLAFYEAHKVDNILDSALQSRAHRALDIEKLEDLKDSYTQIELQGLRPGGDPRLRQDYTRSLNIELTDTLASLAGAFYRSRITALRPGGIIPLHVDDPEQLRVISVLQGRQVFTLFGRTGKKTLSMDPGELWFVNTAWEHEVENPGDIDRVAVLLNLFKLPEVANV